MAVNPGIICEVFIFSVFGLILISILKILIKTIQIVNSQKKNYSLFIEKMKTREEPLNLIGIFILLVFESILIRIKVGFDFNGTNGDYPGYILAAIPAVMYLIILVYNIFKYSAGHSKERRYDLDNEKEIIHQSAKIKIDVKRKIWHFIVMGLIFSFTMIGYYYLKNKTNIDSEFQNYTQEELIEFFWGATNGLNYIKIAFVRHSIPMGQVIIIMFMYGAVMILTIVEMSRLSKNIHCIFHKEAQKKLRFKEIDTFAAYTHFAVGYLFAAMILPPMLLLGAICLASFADPAASLIGMKFGKKRYNWNGKSLVGTISGILAAILTMFPFVGIIYSLIGGFIFGLIDIFTPKPLKLSDNLLMPVVITIVFMILSILGIPCNNIFGL